MGTFDDIKWTDPGFTRMRDKAIGLARGLVDSDMLNALNKVGSAGAISGFANPGALTGETYSRFTGAKTRSIVDTFNNYSMAELQSKDAHNQAITTAKINEKMMEPGLIDWLGLPISALTAAVPAAQALGFFENIPGLIGDGGTQKAAVGSPKYPLNFKYDPRYGWTGRR